MVDSLHFVPLVHGRLAPARFTRLRPRLCYAHFLDV